MAVGPPRHGRVCQARRPRLLRPCRSRQKKQHEGKERSTRSNNSHLGHRLNADHNTGIAKLEASPSALMRGSDGPSRVHASMNNHATLGTQTLVSGAIVAAKRLTGLAPTFKQMETVRSRLRI